MTIRRENGGDTVADWTDFDALKELAATNPDAFEALRRARIEAAITRAPVGRQLQLRRLQWRIEQTRRRAGSPLAACVSISHMMWEAFAGRDGLLDTLRMVPPAPRSAAKVLPFIAQRRP
jgi:hypothetical protein